MQVSLVFFESKKIRLTEFLNEENQRNGFRWFILLSI